MPNRFRPSHIVALALILAIPFVALAAWTGTNSMTVKQTQTCAAGATPTLADDGLLIGNLHSFMVVLEADSTRTLSGTGSVRAWLYDDAIKAWYRYPDADMAVPAALNTFRRGVVGHREVLGGRGRIAYVADTVGVSAGACTIWLMATTRKQ